MGETVIDPEEIRPALEPPSRKRKGASSLTQAASKGVMWSSLTVAARSAIRFVTTAILARQLTPEDFGVLGMAFLVNEMIVLVGELGLTQALVQKKDVDDSYYNTMFWMSLGVGAFLSGVFMIAAPAAAAFFENEQVRPVIMFLALNFLVTSAGSVFRAVLTRWLRFDRFAMINIAGTAVRSAVALTCVFSGFGLWSVVFGMLAERLTSLILLVAVVRWKPQWEFRGDKFWDLFRFSRNLYGENFLRFFNMKSDSLMTGKLIGAAGLGFYQFAYGIPSLVLTHFSQTITEVMFPVYCKVQDDNQRFQRGFVKTLTFISLIAFPLMTGLMVLAPEFIRGIYGPKWIPVIAPLRTLCFLALLNSVLHTMGSVFKAKGRPDIGLKWNIVMLPTTLAGLLIGSRGGVIGIALAMTLVGSLSILPMRKAFNLIGLSDSRALRALWPATASSVLMAALVWLARASFTGRFGVLPDALSLAVWISFGMAAYVLCVRGLWPAVFHDFCDFIRNMFR